ncbi:MAG: GDSL-type esterase/lipase family protein [Candidatus Omnitrophica bacterium]|nr:GDSL-type esterase/lipase family protein [Candidatus Omnitrophota bacterium]
MRLIKNILFSAIVASLLLIAIELASHLYFFIRYHKVYSGKIFEYDAEKAYRLRKNYSGLFAGKPVRTNRFGHRDYDIPLEKPENTLRVLAVGDSITFGHGVLGEEAYPKQLENMLNSRIKEFRFNVINTATPGNLPFQEYYDLKRGLKFKPDIIIIQFTLNDVVRPSMAYRMYGEEKGGCGGVAGLNSKVLIRVNDYLDNHSAFYSSLKSLLIRFKIIERYIIQETDISEDLVYRHNDPEIRKAWSEYLFWAQKKVDLCKEMRIPCVLLISPYKFQLDLSYGQAYPQKELREFAAKNRKECIDLLYNLKSITRGVSECYFLDYSHYTANGHIFIATITCPFIEKHVQELSQLKRGFLSK